MNKLEAVNRVITRAGIGGLPVSALDTGRGSAAGMAERCIDTQSEEIQSVGWHFNTRRGVEITPGSDDTVAVPDEALQIDTDGVSESIDAAEFGPSMYDLRPDKNTTSFDGTLTTRQVILVEFECVPVPIQNYIVAAATADYNRQRGEPTRQFLLEREVERMRAEARKFDTRTAGHNVLQGPHVRAVRGHRINTQPQVRG